MPDTLTYPLRIERCPDENGYLASFPDLPGCQTWGESYEAAVENAEEALSVYLETLIANGDPLPEATWPEGGAALGVSVRRPVAA